MVENVFLESFCTSEQPKKHIRQPVSSRLDYGHLLGSLKRMSVSSGRDIYNEKAKFGFLQIAVMELETWP